MAKPRKTVSLKHKLANNNDTSSSSGSSDISVGTRTLKKLSVWKTGAGFACLLVAVYVGTLGYLETRVNTPFGDEKVVKDSGLAVPERYWGSYRPGVYFGLKTREPKSPVFGLMWYELAPANHKGVRHWCDQNDNLPQYGWTRHDGSTFGEQTIVDTPIEMVTSFVKSSSRQHPGQWTARINVTSKARSKSPFVLIWYGALEESAASRLWYHHGALVGHTPQLNNFKMHIHTVKGKILHTSYSEAHAPGLHLLKEKLYSLLREHRHSTLGRLAVLTSDQQMEDKEPNFVPIQYIVELPFIMDIVYTTEDHPTPPLKGAAYTAELEERKRQFDITFEEKFKMKDKGYKDEDIGNVRSALSNMLGGIGYFYGAGRVRSQYTKQSVPYWRAALYTAVPSRSFFPRGFLWDEGFHQLLIGRWNLDIQMDITAHWLDLINVEGWIPREQILGPEALARVPKEFVVQSNADGNPPILLLQLAHFVRTKPQDFAPGSKHRASLDRMFSRLQAWYQWFGSTLKGSEPTTYRWRSREDDGLQLNPKSLSSGMDDYPRASHPSEIERHVDLRCWMYAAADAMATIAYLLERDSSKFEATRDQLADEDLLNELHWSPHSQSYADYGLHTDGVKLVKQQPKHPNDSPKMVRIVTVLPQPKLVTSAFGYVSLFPMLMKVLKPSSEKLGKILEDLDKPELLWSPYGLRSLSKSSPLYMKWNTEHDPPYWRGQVWININYLALAALKHYSLQDGPHKERAGSLHARLTENIVHTIMSEYSRSGYYWEQYSSEDGRGSGCRPFTGWTALVTLIMADEY